MPSQAGVPISFNDSKWTHLNTPTSPPAISSDGVQITVLSGPKTDWWRTTSVDSSSGVVYGFKKGVGDGFEVSVDLGIDHQVKATASDHATVFLRLSSHTWVKAGVEYDLGKLWNSVVVTNPYSDWYVPLFYPVLPCSQFLPYKINPSLTSDTIQVPGAVDSVLLHPLHNLPEGQDTASLPGGHDDPRSPRIWPRR
ncbi:hypothetical protein FIBSPDRAFT_848016 [Athelia psychrophila]|uniref:Uncharacterized protein n=1 Tax=Athelia psychrophila TaxID=1759441 RepID=A0A166VIJ2_9AGAM|nr:hypothetical protein FIBSPDRAFT_848016 [Fibularhizoctonia sp. CBS 109695]